jgi:glucose dehydrogenase
MAINTSVALRGSYALCLLGAASTHVLTIATHGLFWDYGGVPIATRIYWTSLTVLDPLAAILLFARPRVGLLFTLAIITTDVAHNTWMMQQSTAPNWWNWMYVLQVIFLVFVLLSIPFAWRATQPESTRKQLLKGDVSDAA